MQDDSHLPREISHDALRNFPSGERITAGVVHGGYNPHSEAMTRDEIVTMFARREEDFARKDSAALSADYTADAVIYSPSSGVHQGRAAAEAFDVIFKAFADITRRTEAIVVDGAQVAEVLAFEGTNLGGLMGLPPNGRHFSVPGVFLYELSGAQIVRERRIYDFTGVLIQVGVMKARPS